MNRWTGLFSSELWQSTNVVRLVMLVILLAMLGAAMGLPLEPAARDALLITVGVVASVLALAAAKTRPFEYENLVHYSRDAILILTADGRFEYLNPAALLLSGYRLGELRGHSFLELIAPNERSRTQQAWNDLRAGIIPQDPFIVHIQPKNNSPRTLALTTALLDRKGKRFAIIARDITTQEIQQREYERRHRELETERVVAAAISQTIALDEVLRVALAKVLETLRYDAGAIYLADEAQTTLTLAVTQNLSDEFVWHFIKHTFGEGITGRAAIQRDIVFEPISPARAEIAPLADGRFVSSQISVPLIYLNRVVGVLNINSVSAQPPTEQDLALLRTIASSLALAIDRARLFETLEQRVVQRTTELATLNRIAAAANQSLDLNVVLNAALDALIQTLAVQGGWVSRVDRERGTLHMLVQRGLPATVIEDSSPLHLGEGISGQVAVNGHTRAVNLEDSPIPTQERLLAAGFQSVCATPLAVQGQVIGVLGLLSQQKNRFGEAELRWLDAVGNTVAVAMQNAQLFESERRAREKAEALRQAAYTISGSLKLEAVLRLMLEQLKRVLTYDTASILLLRDADQPLLISGMGYTDETTTSRLASDLLKTSPILARMARDLQPVNIADVREHPDWIWVPGAEHVRSFLGVPIISQGKMIGALMADSIHVAFFKDDDVQHAQTLAQHIALALQNAQLFESVEKQLNQITTLREIDRTLNSMLELEPMLDASLDLVAQLVPYDYAAIFTLEGHWLRAVAGRGISAEALRHLAFDTSQHPGFYQIWRRHRPVILRNVHASKDWIITPGLEDVQAWLGVPLIARGQVLGQLSLYYRTPNAITQEHSDLAWAFANHAAIALANARLRAELNDQAQRDSLTQVLNHGTFISQVRQACEQATQANKPVSLIMLDLDDFKRYNDMYGHVIGDQVLTVAAQAIRAHIKQTDLVGRWGGEEFGVALLGASQPQAMLVAERIRKTLATAQIQGRDSTPIPPPTVSQGIAVLGQTAHTFDELIERADRALYHAKHRGKDQIVCAQ